MAKEAPTMFSNYFTATVWALLGRSGKSSLSRRVAPLFRPQVEPLETRELLSASGASTGSLTAGQQFTWDEEVFINHPYHPTPDSGVTIGVGYDVRERSSASIIADLTAAGVGQATAKKVAGAAGLTGSKADDFVRDNTTLTISRPQAT